MKSVLPIISAEIGPLITGTGIIGMRIRRLVTPIHLMRQLMSSILYLGSVVSKNTGFLSLLFDFQSSQSRYQYQIT